MKFKLMMVVLSVFAISACSSLLMSNGNKGAISSSLMEFLYPDETSRAEHVAEIPTLTLPVKVGLAFVPSTNWARDGINSSQQIALLENVKKSFMQYDFINNIEIIPSDYLKGGQGFETLEQVSRLYDVDVMALVSYDQVTQSTEKKAALLYWTIVGMYVIPANENSVQTFVDTAVFDVKSRKMLFRAPGISKLEESSTAIKIDAVLAEKSIEGFTLAVDDMNKNLDAELSRFRTRVKEENVAKIERRAGYSGGSLAYFGLLVLGATMVLRRKYSAA
ncbi:rhombotarget lipoprotein [Glaciecola sp. MF2-115]|uniref:rhombotarget lipoprotein n=1 Tax=Glaciecola sp. MF2-115 TaxID=3384827 RepID=UPI0039A04291